MRWRAARGRRWRRLAALSILAVLATCLAVGLFPREPLRRLAERELRTAFGPGSSLGGLDLVPARLEVEVRDLVIDSASFRLELPRGYLSLAPGPVLSLLVPGWGGAAVPLVIRAVRLDSPRLEMGPSTSGAGPRSAPPSIVVRQLDLNGGTLAYSSEPGRATTLRGVDAHGSLGRGSLLLTVLEGTWPGAPAGVGPARAELRVSPDLGVDVASLAITAGRSRLEARGPLGRPGAWTPDLDLSAHVEMSDLGAFGAPPVGGSLDLGGRLAGAADALTLDVQAHGSVSSGRVEAEAHLAGHSTRGRLRFSQVELDRLPAAFGVSGHGGRASGELRWSGDIAASVRVWAEAEATLTARGRTLSASLDVSGPVEPSRRRIDLEWDAQARLSGSRAIARPSPDALPTLVAGQLRASGRARGEIPPVVTGDMGGELSFSSPGGPLVAAVAGNVRNHARGTTVELQVHGLDGELRLEAEADGSEFRRLSVQGDRLRLEPLGAAGQAHLSLAATGPWDRLSGSARLDVEGAGWRGVKLGHVSVEAESRAGDLKATLVVPALGVRGQARLPPGVSSVLSASLELLGSPPEALAPLFVSGLAVSGAVSGRVDLTAPLARPHAAEVEAHVQQLRLRSGQWLLESREPFVLTEKAGRVEIGRLALSGPGLRLDVSGSAGMGRDRPLDLRLEAGVDLGRLPPVPGLTWGGAVHARVALSGNLDRPRANGSVDLRDLTLAGERLPRVEVPEARIDLDGSALRVPPLLARLGKGKVEVEGQVPLAALDRAARRDPVRLSPEEGAELTIQFEGVHLDPFVAQLRTDRVSPLAGRVSGRVDVSGGLASLDEARASLRIVPEGVAVGDLPLDVSPLLLRLARGGVVLESATLSGQGSRLTIGGRLDFESRTLDASARGDLRLRALSPFLPETAVAGRADLDLAVSGPLDALQSRGQLTVHDGTLRLRALPQSLTGIEARLALEGNKIRIEEATGALGGGRLSLSGQAALAAGSLSDVDLQLAGKDVALRYPEGLRSRLDADLQLTGKAGALKLSGLVRAQRGLYDLDVAIEQGFLGAAPSQAPSPLLRSVALDLRVETVNPVLVRNNLAQLDATGSLNVLGDLETPAPVGRLDIREGGRVSLQQREFTIESGRLSYDGTWNPQVSLQAKAVLRGVDLGDVYGRQDVEVGVSIQGPLARPRVTFTSDPPGYNEAEIVSMIVTNRARAQAVSSGAWVAGEQAALFLTGRLTRGLTSELKSLGLDEVTIQPELLARETDPGARFTFGKHLTDQLRLIYSLSLNDPENRFIELDLDPGRDISLLAQRRDDGSFTLGAGQQLRFFGPRRRPLYREPKIQVREVAIETRGDVSEQTVRDILHTKAGKTVSEWDLQDDAERVRESLRARGYIEAEATARSEDGKAAFRVESGPRFQWRVEGMADAPSLDDAVLGSLFEDEALDRGRDRLLAALHGRGYLDARVDASATGGDGRRTLVFRVTPGEPQRVKQVHFPGASLLSHDRLLEAAGGAAKLLSDPDGARQGIREAYRQRQRLAASVKPPEVERDPDGLTITVPVEEGPPALVQAVGFPGASLPQQSLAEAAKIPAGAPFRPVLVDEAVYRLFELYYASGYPNVRIAPRVEVAGHDVDVVFDVTEGEHLTLGAVEISGLRHTRESLVRRTLGFRTGDPLDPRRLAAAERKLLALGTFSRVSVTHSRDDPVTVRVEVEEEPRLVAGYQARYNDDRGLSGDLEGVVRNLFGRGLALGTRYSRSRDDEQIRGSIQLPSLAFLGSLTGSIFRDSQELPVVEGGPTFVQLQKGLELQLTRPLPDRWNLLYGYRLKTSKVTSELDEFGTSTRIASLDVSLLRDTRDNALDAHRGRFWSVNLEIAPRALASELDFVKGMGQLFVTRSFSPSVVWAQGYRLGLAHTFSGERLVFSERFKAGGPNSVRGYATDSLGPRDVFGDPAGGEAVLVFNQELRYMSRWGVGGVVFWDAGNVFAKASDLSLDLRHALGVGLRWDSPLGLLRVDLGFPLAPREGEKPSRLFFSIGQAF